MSELLDRVRERLGDAVIDSHDHRGDDTVLVDAARIVETDTEAEPVAAPPVADEALADEPELVNSSPYEDGWIFRLRPTDATVLDDKMDAEAYERFLAELED